LSFLVTRNVDWEQSHRHIMVIRTMVLDIIINIINVIQLFSGCKAIAVADGTESAYYLANGLKATTTQGEDRKMLQKIRNRKGFTLVELMIVVAIIGILAAIAIPNFLQFRLKAKTSEAKSNLGAIRSTEVAYFAEWDYYIGNQAPTPITDRTGNANKEPWVTSTRFSILGFAPEGNVFYSYALSGSDFEPVARGVSMYAVGDLDATGGTSTFYVTDSTNEVIKVGAAF
jgi:type IV pilus assembly protein PilA